MVKDSFGARTTLSVDGKKYDIYKLEALERRGFNLSRMPYSIKVMIENVLRREREAVLLQRLELVNRVRLAIDREGRARAETICRH